jgi:hypothetical protein
MEALMMRLFSILGVVAAMAVVSAEPATARGWQPPPVIGPQFQDPALQNRVFVRPLHELLPTVRRQLRGDFVGMVRLDQVGLQPSYVIRWRFEDGRIGDVRIDALSGALLDR